MSFPASTETDSIEWIVPDFILSWQDESCDWTLRPYRRAFNSGELTILSAGVVYGFLMVAPARELGALTFDFAGPMRAAGLWVELSVADGIILRRAFVDTSAIRDCGQAWVMDLSGLRFEIGAKLHVRLTVVALEDSDQVYIAATPQPATGVAFHTQMERLHNDRTFVYGRPNTVAAANVVIFPQGATLAQTTPALKLLAAAFPGEDFTGVYADKPPELWRRVESAEVVAFADFHAAARAAGADYDRLCFELNRRGVCTLAIDTQTLESSPVKDGPVARTVKTAVEDQQRCRFILRDGPTLYGADQPFQPAPAAPALGREGALSALRAQVRAAMLPKVAIVSTLPRQADIVQAFLDCIRRQTYPGQIVAALGHDGSPGAGAEAAEAFQEQLEALGQNNRTVRVVQAPTAAGPSQLLTELLKVEPADIYAVINGGSLLNRDFVAAHVFEQAHPAVDIVMSLADVGAGDGDPAERLRSLEQDSAGIRHEVSPQLRDFVESEPRSFSIKARAPPPEGLFDPDLDLLSDTGPGLGWANAEMAYRLYARGAQARFTSKAFCVSAARPSSPPKADEIRGAMRSFETILAKDEGMALVARRWAVSTFDRLAAEADQSGVQPDETRRRLDTRFAAAREWQAPLIAVMRGRSRRLRVLSYRWHAPHQYELYKLPHDFTLATGVGDNGMVEYWPYDQRPLRANAKLRPASEIDPADYDVALLHFDENVLAPELCNNTIPAAWGDPFHWLLDTDLPKVAICHGTPQFVGQYGADPQRKSAFTVHEDERLRLVALLAGAGVHVVCNSHQAQGEWGFSSSQVIWHGFDPQDFPEGRGDLDVLALSPDPHRPHYRGAWEQIEIEAGLEPAIRVQDARHFGGALEVRGTNAYAIARFRAYADRIGRFKAYLNTTLRSPMPRSRGEAMMTGVVPVCLDNHDVSRFIQNGVNGFYAQEPAALADFLNHLCRNESEARRMRAVARRTALDLFNHDRYLTAWAELMERTAR